MKEVERQTLLEVQQGLCAPGMDEAAFCVKFTDKDGVLCARPMPRHGVYHGKKLAGDGITVIDKIRAIDEALISRSNEAVHLHESLMTSNFEFPTRVAAELARLCD